MQLKQKPVLGYVADMRVIPIPILGSSKNYAYLLASKTGKAAAIDPAEPETVLQHAEKEGLTVDTVLTTHKHWDHAGGNDKIKKLVKGIKVIGGVNDNVQGATEDVKDGDCFNYNEIYVECIETPFHTMGHICYLCKSDCSDHNTRGEIYQPFSQDRGTSIAEICWLKRSCRGSGKASEGKR